MRKVGFVVFVIFGLIAIRGFVNLSSAEPKYLEKKEVTKTMIQWNKALGVKCSYCHTSDRAESYEGLSGKTVGEKELNALVRKRVAVTMLGTMLSLNQKEGKDYTCDTCHQGKALPALEQAS
jgi:hypothetical protein